MTRPSCIINQDSVAWMDESHGEGYAMKRRQLGAAAGGREIGCSIYELPPGGRTWPYHWHAANEEAIYVLEGQGMLRHPGGECPIGPGDYLAFPVGETGAHQVTNPSQSTLRFLCISTMIDPEVAVYPDAGKIGVFIGSAPGRMEGRKLMAFLPLAAQVGYWEEALRKATTSPEWKADLEKNYWSDDFATSAKFRKDLEGDYAAMSAVLTELGLARKPAP